MQDLSKKWEPLHLEVTDVQDKAHELEKVSCISSSTVISKMSENVKHKWQALVSSLENKKETLSNIKKHWEDFTTQKDSVEKSLLEMEDALPEVNIEKSSLLELDTQLRTVKVIHCFRRCLREVQNPTLLKLLNSCPICLLYLVLVSLF